MIRNLDNSNFDLSVAAPGVHVVRFGAPWCGPCRLITPFYTEIAADMAGKAQFFEIDVDAAESIAVKYEIKSLPTILIFKQGRQVDKMVGTATKDRIDRFIRQHLG